MDSSNEADLKPETINEVKTDGFRSKDAEDDLMTPGDKLCEDELTVIFSNSWISPRDLLNFRLVSKSWRDAATATLLQRDALVVELYEDSNRAPPCFYKNRQGKKMHENKLSQLTKLISNSPKFPSTNFHIMTMTSGNFTPYTHFPDLMHFFKLHGHNIKTLRPHGWITKKFILDILLIYAPTLEHLDLSEASIPALSKQEGGDENALKWTSKTLPFKSLTITDFYPDYCEHPKNCYEDREFSNFNATGLELVHLLLSSPSKLNCIENVTLRTLGIFLTEGIRHLIRSFKYKFYDSHLDFALDVTMKNFLILNPAPSKVALDLGCGHPSDVCVTTVNRFIQSFKDTVQNVTLSFSYDKLPWDKLLSIPPMKKLKSLTLTITDKTRDSIRCKCVCGGCAEDRDSDTTDTNMDLRGTVFRFEDGISAENYFPSLTEVSLNSNQSSGYPDVSLINFFLFKSDTNGSFGNWNCLPKVDILGITRSYLESGPRLEGTCQSPAKGPLISEVFPKIRILKFRCGKASNLSGNLWTLFPNVEFIEIYGIRSFSTIGWSDSMMNHSHHVDEAFTGFADQMLEEKRRLVAKLFCEADDSDELKSALTAPSISDLRHLRELKLMFVGKWSYEFASSVTGVRAFSQMPNTKFIISYDPETVLGLRKDRAECPFSDYVDGDDIAEYEELIFGAIKPYVHIIHEKQNYVFE